MKKALLALILLTTALAHGQSAPATQVGATNDTGLSPHVPYSLGLGDVNLTNGNLSLEIPLFNIPSRNGNSFNLALQYESKNWVPIT